MSLEPPPVSQPEPFDVVSEDSGEWWCRMTLSGEFDLAASPRFLRAVDDALRRDRRHVAVDASALTFMDSSGLVALLSARKDLTAAGGSLRLTAISVPVARVLELAGLADELIEQRR